MSEVDRQALATTIGVVAAIFVALAANLEQPFWAGISALIISNVDRTELFTKGVLRILGTIAGVVSGYFISLVIGGQPLIQAVLLMAVAGGGTYARQRSRYGYVWFYGALTFLLVLVCSMTTPEQLYAFAHYRCYEIIIGVLAATIAGFALGPKAGQLPDGVRAHPSNVTVEAAGRYAFAAAVGALVLVLVWSLFGLPALTQVLASSLVVVDIDPRATRKRGLQRILGCLIGGGAGLVIIGINADVMLWWVTTLSLGIFLSARVHLGPSPNAYVGTQSAVALLVTMVGSGPPDSIAPAFDRLVGIALGVALMSLVVWMLEQRNMPETPSSVPAGEHGTEGR
ncbi:FUSC family protein [Kaistia dalseonensis]|uniref:Membrane protein YccC n=1 Tax=Kaistia dalseonensis TaxID=410840 RepID=A0ABU0H183_9HYPH|nr:FUSC family protein [Kaistia dalseonensis]MCX5493512.1 FUSC family protein [Kaistia dalseonensis]MDQ0436072.1 putative membrane protein YccC [Kaistia dalseonensis]